jgi:cytokinin riboside 5'-monophosphate phosphoribohydrolase
MQVTVYTSSSDAVDERYRRAARALGRELGTRGHGLVYGGTAIGLMGEVADATRAANGRVVGVVPQLMADRGLIDDACDEVVITDDMAGRKATMFASGEAYVAAPGGFGTLEELLEVLTLKQLGQHDKAIVLFDAHGFWQPLLALFTHLFEARFAKPVYAELYTVVDDAVALVDHLETYEPPALPTKWY